MSWMYVWGPMGARILSTPAIWRTALQSAPLPRRTTRAGPVRPEVHRTPLAKALGKEGPLPRGQSARRPEEVRPRHAAVPVRGDAHGARAGVLHHRRAGPLCAQAWVRRPAPLRLGFLRS